MRHFEQGKSFLTLRVEDIREDVRSFMQRGKEVASDLRTSTTQQQNDPNASTSPA